MRKAQKLKQAQKEITYTYTPKIKTKKEIEIELLEKQLFKPTRLIVDFKDRDILQALCNECTREWGWMSLVKIKDGDYYMKEIFIPEQEATAASVNIEAEAWGKLFQELKEAGEDVDEIRENLLLWGHSHQDMSVGESSVDQTQVAEFMQAFRPPFIIMAVINKQMEWNVRVCNSNLTSFHLPVSYTVPPSSDIATKKIEELKAKNKGKSYRYQGGYGYNNYNNTQNKETRDLQCSTRDLQCSDCFLDYLNCDRDCFDPVRYVCCQCVKPVTECASCHVKK